MSSLLLPLASMMPAQEGDGGPVPGAPRLCDSIESPYAYVSIDSDPVAQQTDPGAVHRLLADPALDVVFAARAEHEHAASKDGSQTSLAFLRRLLLRGTRELELVMTGIVPTAGRPLLVLRARMQAEHADKLREVMAAPGALVPSRRLGDCQVYRSASSARDGAPGQSIELALVGDDLVVGNDGSALHEVLAPRAARTSAQPQRHVLSADPRYRALREQLEVPAGTLLAYGDWRRLGRRLQSTLPGVSAQLLLSSGLGSARSVLVSIAPAQQARRESCERDFDITLLLDFDRSTAIPAGSGIDGWFAATEPAPAKQLLRELPRRGLGGLVLSVDLAAVATHSSRSSHLLCQLRDAFTRFGLDFERNVLSRLAQRGTVQLHFGRGDEDRDAFASVSPVYSLRAKSRQIAQQVFDDLTRVVSGCDVGQLVEGEHDRRRRTPILHLHGRGSRHDVYATVVGDALLFAENRAALAELGDERSKARRETSLLHALEAIGGDDVAGLFDVDLAPLFERLTEALPGADLSSLPRRHIGYLATDDRDGGATVRVRLLSSH